MIPSKQSKECYEMLIGFPLYPGYFIFCTVLLLITRLDIRRNPKRQGDKGEWKGCGPELQIQAFESFLSS